MTRRTMTLFASLFALLLSASAFAGGSPPETTNSPMSSLSVGISGCISSGTGEFYCSASVSGGSGSYNYWWQLSGTGQLYQTNSPSVEISGCVNGSFTLTVQVLDTATGQIARSAPYSCSCNIIGGGGGGGGGLFGF